jgi:ABC-2 type transport system permease protein
VFMADIDNVLASGLFEVEGALAAIAPLRHPHELFRTAVLEGHLAEGHLLPVVAWLGALLVVALLAYARATNGGVFA